MSDSIRAAGLAACVSLAGCAEISAPPMDFGAPVTSTTLRAAGINRFFSRFTSSIGVDAVSLTRGGAPVAAPAAAYLGLAGATSTYRFTPMGAYAPGDVLTVRWSGDTVDLAGRKGTVRKAATYRFVSAVLRVEAPLFGLQPGKAGRVCVALQPNAAADTTVVLASTVFPSGVMPTTLTIPAGQSKATATATIRADGFSCPRPTTGSSTSADTLPVRACTGQNGVTASAVYGGATLTACAGAGGTCCGVTQNCGAPAVSRATIC